MSYDEAREGIYGMPCMEEPLPEGGIRRTKNPLTGSNRQINRPIIEPDWPGNDRAYCQSSPSCCLAARQSSSHCDSDNA